MSTNKLIKTISRQIEKVNDTIDIKIIRGESYKKEALRHKFLLHCLEDAKREMKREGGVKGMDQLMGKFAHMISSFIL